MPRMWLCEHLETIDSTQREALRRIAQINPDSQAPFALWTTRQTQGVGSHGRPWQDSPGGGLAISIAWPEEQKISTSFAWPARLSLLVLLALERCYPVLRNRLGLKWPNDILNGDAKLAGVLVSRHQVHGRWWLIAGFGVNLWWDQWPTLDRAVTDLRTLGVGAADPQQLVQAVCADMERLWNQQYLAKYCEQEFARRDVLAGKMVNVVHPQDGGVLHQGENAGVTSAGELLLRCGARIITVSIGELSLRRASP